MVATADTPWIAFGSIATAVLALGTLLALLQGRSERKQIVNDRELAWRPQLSGSGYEHVYVDGLGLRPEDRWYPQINNNGGGPAIAARLLWSKSVDEERHWFVTTPFDVPAKGEVYPRIGVSITEEVAKEILDSLKTREILGGAFFCRDFLERKWAFPILECENHAILEPEQWRKAKLYFTSDKRMWPKDPWWVQARTLWKA